MRQYLAVGAFGGFLAAQQAARRMLPKGRGAILFTGASASVKGFALSSPFADRPGSMPDPYAIARTYLDVLEQPRSAWSFEDELLPWTESF